MRRCSAAALKEIGFDGYAVGGLAVGEGQEAMFEVLDVTVPELPEDRPRYLMGVGKPADIVGAVKRGIDMFDCVLPTRSGRTGQAFTRRGSVNIFNARHRDDPVVVQIVPGQKDRTKHLLCLEEVMQVGAAIVAAGRAGAVGVQRARVVTVAGVHHVERQQAEGDIPEG